VCTWIRKRMPLATYSTIRNQTSKVEGIEHKASMDNLLHNPHFFMIQNPPPHKGGGGAMQDIATQMKGHAP
jgi:hypothetical protein